jgi:hypothetical protein
MVSAKAKNGNGRPPALLSPEGYARFMAAADAMRRRTRTKAAAQKLLVEEGIFTKTGKLTKNYS